MPSIEIDPDGLSEMSKVFGVQSGAIERSQSTWHGRVANLHHDVGGGDAGRKVNALITSTNDALKQLRKSLNSFTTALGVAADNASTAESKSELK